ncbi:hypothetical protein ACIHQR_32020 [Corallococcus coralloides]|uniref:hypothetical protein n=1 Tax=Corallococcus coralloides TaxID=184914 RepID=UPI00384A76C4
MAESVIDNRVEVVFSFDTTGSMYPCLAQVRKKLGAAVARLTKEIPGIRIGIIAHGDYCDAKSTYVTKALDLTDDVKAITRFVEKVEQTGGGDAPGTTCRTRPSTTPRSWAGARRWPRWGSRACRCMASRR